jgi:hypothetical protein
MAFRPRRESVFVEEVQIDETWVSPTYAHTPEEVDRLRGYVAKTILLSHLNTQSRDAVIDALERKEYPKGANIITQALSFIRLSSAASKKIISTLCRRALQATTTTSWTPAMLKFGKRKQASPRRLHCTAHSTSHPVGSTRMRARSRRRSESIHPSCSTFLEPGPAPPLSPSRTRLPQNHGLRPPLPRLPFPTTITSAHLPPPNRRDPC